jgi:peptide/nickel transport system permease protein
VTRLGRLVLRRLVQAVPTVLGVVALNFVLLHLLPGDIVDALTANAPSAGVDFKAELRAEMGLDKPVWLQFLIYMGNILRFDFGYSYTNSLPVIDVIWARVGATLVLMLSSILLAFIASVVLGVYAARKVNSWADNLIMVLALVFYATPVFWIGLMMIVLFAVKLNWLPVGGFATIGVHLGLWGSIVDVMRHLLMPMTSLTLFFLAVYTRLMRASMLEVYGLDFVRTARAKGLTEGRIAYRHVLRNALLPVVTMVGLQIGAVLGGAVVVETVFSWPGIGRLAYDAVFQRDYQVLIGILYFGAILVIVTNLLMDLLYTRLDPRIELR